MAQPFTPITKPLEEMTRTELFEIAQERQIPGRHDMTKAALLKAVEEAVTAPEPKSETEPAPPLEETDGTEPLAGPGDGSEEGDDEDSDDDQDALNDEDGDEDEDGESEEGDEDEEAAPETNRDPKPQPPAADPNELALMEQALLEDAKAREAKTLEDERLSREAAEQARLVENARLKEQREKADADRLAAHAAGQLTEEDRLDLMRADADDLVDLLDAEDTPEFVKAGIRVEQERRKQTAKLNNATKLMQSPHKQFKITAGPKDFRYVTPTSYVTTLPLGSIVSPLSYDLKHLAEQGFEWEQIKGVQLGEDQLGNQTSAAK